TYLAKLIVRRNNGDVKVVTGPRRCGKSWLLSHIYKNYLVDDGVPLSNIISIDFDKNDERYDFDILDVDALKKHIYSRVADGFQEYYVFLDEIQELPDFERFVNGLAAHENVDVYVTGSNSKMLSNDIRTIFRGRGDEVQVYPLSFREFCQSSDRSPRDLWKEYCTFGGMPRLLHYNDNEQKIAYLNRLWNKTYFDDVIERYNIRNTNALEALARCLSSSIGSLTNPTKLANTIQSVQHLKIDDETVGKYLTHLKEAYLFDSAERYDVKGKRYFESIKKYYSVDIGLRNSLLNFRQQEPTHIMENIIFNHLKSIGFLVDVGVVEERKMKNGKSAYSQREIDFIANKGSVRYYIQSAYSIPDNEKMQQELASLINITESFKKIVVMGDDIVPHYDENGIFFIGILDFLLGDSWQ
ncbi:MAG: ATP-binding protein, partial [Muribaculaceae bacterium]|nr:ATP-binding protein [Muribaculaceae bacterium]